MPLWGLLSRAFVGCVQSITDKSPCQPYEQTREGETAPKPDALVADVEPRVEATALAPTQKDCATHSYKYHSTNPHGRQALQHQPVSAGRSVASRHSSTYTDGGSVVSYSNRSVDLPSRQLAEPGGAIPRLPRPQPLASSPYLSIGDPANAQLGLDLGGIDANRDRALTPIPGSPVRLRPPVNRVRTGRALGAGSALTPTDASAPSSGESELASLARGVPCRRRSALEETLYSKSVAGRHASPLVGGSSLVLVPVMISRTSSYATTASRPSPLLEMLHTRIPPVPGYEPAPRAPREQPQLAGGTSPRTVSRRRSELLDLLHPPLASPTMAASHRASPRTGESTPVAAATSSRPGSWTTSRRPSALLEVLHTKIPPLPGQESAPRAPREQPQLAGGMSPRIVSRRHSDLLDLLYTKPLASPSLATSRRHASSFTGESTPVSAATPFRPGSWATNRRPSALLEVLHTKIPPLPGHEPAPRAPREQPLLAAGTAPSTGRHNTAISRRRSEIMDLLHTKPSPPCAPPARRDHSSLPLPVAIMTDHSSWLQMT